MSIWFDESYSLWATNNNLSFRYLFSDILRHETNPPVYFVFLKLARLIYDQNIITGKFLNIFILFLSILFILKESSDKHLKNIFLYVILGSSASLAYAGEIRPLFSAICVAHVLSYFYIMAESREISRPFIKTITASILLSLIHVYGAIFAISIALAVALSGFLYKRNDLTKLSLTTLVFSFSAFLVWWIWINSTDRDALATVRWLSNDPMFIVAALKEGAGYIIGRGAISYAVALLAFVFFTLSKNIRISRLIFLSTLGLFFFLPVLISWKVPIVFGRYFAIGCGPLLAIFLTCAWREVNSRNFEQYDIRKVILASCGIALFIITAVLGPITAINALRYRPYWTGIDTVTKFAGECSNRKIRVIDPINLDETFRSERASAHVLYGYKLLATRSGFDIADGRESIRDVSEIDCPVVAWIEHSNLFEDGREAVTLSQLRALRLTNRYGLTLSVFRHRMGAVVVKTSTVSAVSE